jgi:gamma-glutamylcyclotransferase (GGCT)/AIG2-like uncharacterized protein YtfP
MKLLLVYGSLRKGGWLHIPWLALEPIRKLVIPNYSLFPVNNAYPTISKGKGSLVTELYEVEEEVYEKIKKMEENAGYHEEKVKIEEGTASLFAWTPEQTKNMTIIPEGDWIKIYKNNEQSFI